MEKNRMITNCDGYYYDNHTEFVPLIDNFRKVSNDKTPLEGNYISFARNVYDMIDDSDEKPIIEGKYIIDIIYDGEKNQLLISYNDKTSKVIDIEDNFLSSVSYDNTIQAIRFKLKDGNEMLLDINLLEDVFCKKDYVDSKFLLLMNTINNKNYLKWEKF